MRCAGDIPWSGSELAVGLCEVVEASVHLGREGAMDTLHLFLFCLQFFWVPTCILLPLFMQALP